MKLQLGLRNACLRAQSRPRVSYVKAISLRQWIRCISGQGPARLSTFWIPTGGIASTDNEDGSEGAHALLIRAGFIRQSHSGLYQFLPLGLRVQEKVEKLIDKHMQSLGASKLSLSTLSSEDLWRRSGRLQGDRSELFQLADRKGAKYLLAPTHEEEITSLVASLVHSHRDLPLKLYQITRKYRDEARPRAGLLRSREFLMKDLYTFDLTADAALTSYHATRKAYTDIFAELKLPVFSAAASSGDIGGDISHEYHLPSPLGEDDVLVCRSCNWAGNVEVVEAETPALSAAQHVPAADQAETEDPKCPSCHSHALEHTRAIELGHTFYLGTKYSEPLEATVANPASEAPTTPKPLEMGCHGIGISRLIAGAATHLSDARGLNWPARISPFEVVVIARKEAYADKARDIAEGLSAGSGSPEGTSETAGVDAVLDDRTDKEFIWKLKDADLVGYPVIVVLGRAWEKEGKVEVQCRRRAFKEEITIERLQSVVRGLIQAL